MKHMEALTDMLGVAAHESRIRKYMKTHLSPLSDTMIQDRIGSIFGVHHGKQKTKVAIVAHMDEVGFMITKIEENGLLRFQPLGGIWSQTLMGTPVVIFTEEDEIHGVITSIAPHLLTPEKRNKVVDVSDLWIDIGAASRADAIAFGVESGMVATYYAPSFYSKDKKRYFAKAIDNRYGCALTLDVAAYLANKETTHTYYVGASVQEEVGLRGAKTVSQMIKPDFAIVLDASPAIDFQDKEGFGRLGEGPLIRIVDPGMIMMPDMKARILELAESHQIPHQIYVSQGNTDASIIQYSGIGVPTIVIGLPARYIHTSLACMEVSDYENAYQLAIQVCEMLEGLDLDGGTL